MASRSAGGQIYFVHNEVRDIEKVTNDLQRLVPEASIRFGHGQMRERELERIQRHVGLAALQRGLREQQVRFRVGGVGGEHARDAALRARGLAAGVGLGATGALSGQ